MFHVLDYGKKRWTFLSPGMEDCIEVTQDCVISGNLPGVSKGDTLVLEAAHFAPQTRYSIAQPLTQDERLVMIQNYEDLGINLRIINQGITPKARSLAGCPEKSDYNDLKGILEYAPTVAANLTKPSRAEGISEYQRSMNAYQTRVSDTCTYITHSGEKGPAYLAVKEAFDKLLPDLTDDEKTLLKVEYYKVGAKKGTVKIKLLSWPMLRAITASFMDIDGTLHTINGRLPNLKELYHHALGCKQHHSKSGSAAAKWKHDRRPGLCANPYKNPEQFRSDRAHWDRVLKGLLKKFKTIFHSA